MQTMALGLDHRGVRPPLRDRLRDRDRQKFFVTFLGGKLIGLALFFLLITQLAPWLIGHIAGAANVSQVDADALQTLPDEHDQRRQHGVDPCCRVPRVLHAGRLHDARGRLRPHP